MFNFCTGWPSVISYFSRPGKELPVATRLEAVGLRDTMDAVENKKPAPLPVIESRFPARPTRSVVTFKLATLTVVHNKQQRFKHIAGQFKKVHDSDDNKNTRTVRHTFSNNLPIIARLRTSSWQRHGSCGWWPASHRGDTVSTVSIIPPTQHTCPPIYHRRHKT
jgi:hypothetical protein